MADADDLKKPTEQEEEVIDDAADELEPEEQAEAAQVEEPEEVEEDEPEPQAPSRREQLRVQQLLAKIQEKQAPKTPDLPKDGLNYADSLDADAEVVEQLEADRRKFGETAYQRGLEQARSIQFHTRLEIDAPRVEAKYPQLDKTAQEFNPVLADTINQMYLSAVGYDKDHDTVRSGDVRYADYVESIFELADEIASVKTAESSKNIAAQASKTGIRPGGASTKLNLNKAPSQMTDEELQAVIATAIPKQ
jgi:hypothetical protein